MTKWLARRRFNHIDAVGIFYAATFVGEGQWLAAAAAFLAGVVVSTLVEQAASAKGN